MKRYIAALLLIPFLFSGCSDTTDHQPKTEQKKTIVTSFYPLTFITQSIVQGNFEVINLAGNNEIHDFIPTPKDIMALDGAALIVLHGAGLEHAWAEDIMPQWQQKNIPVAIVTKNIPLQSSAVHAHEEEEHDDHEGEEHHDHGGFDPHIWLSPVMAQKMTEVILAEVQKIDPANASIYKKNADELIAKLQAEDVLYAKALSSCARKEAIISHNAFGYLERQYGIALHPIAGISTTDEPSAKLLSELKEEAKEGVYGILTEENRVQRFAQMISKETGLAMFPITTLETNGKPFFEGYAQNRESLSKALQCQ